MKWPRNCHITYPYILFLQREGKFCFGERMLNFEKYSMKGFFSVGDEEFN